MEQLGAVASPELPNLQSCSSCSLLDQPLPTSVRYRNGVQFEGYLARRPRAGRGSFQWHSGLSYIGDFKDDKREGFGRMSWPDGSVYEGFFHNDLREGHGKHTWGDTGQVGR